MKKQTSIVCVLACASLLAGPSYAQTEESEAAPPPRKDPATMSVADISECMQTNIVDRGSLRDFDLTSTDREGKTRTLKMKVFWKPAKDGGAERMTLQVLEPADYARSAYLVVSKPEADDVYLYLPALSRVQRVTGDDLAQPLWGTDFTYTEVKQVQGMLQDGDSKRTEDRTVFNRPVFVIDTTTDFEQTGYTMVRTFVDQQSCTILKTELFGISNSLVKVLDADLNTLLEVPPYWLMLGYTMKDLRAGTHTDLKLSDVFLLERLPEALFTPEGFYLPHE
jgi:hypothetical protein